MDEIRECESEDDWADMSDLGLNEIGGDRPCFSYWSNVYTAPAEEHEG